MPNRPTVYAHYGDLPPGLWPWPNFAPVEMACRHCGELYFDPAFMEGLQAIRDALGTPMRINSAHRCAVHNARVGGAPLSMHKKIAADVSLHNQDPAALLSAARRAGMTGFGGYGTFLHLDRGRPRVWITAAGRAIWTSLLTS